MLHEVALVSRRPNMVSVWLESTRRQEKKPCRLLLYACCPLTPPCCDGSFVKPPFSQTLAFLLSDSWERERDFGVKRLSGQGPKKEPETELARHGRDEGMLGLGGTISQELLSAGKPGPVG